MGSSLRRSHFVLFPFMAKGHTIPLTYLARLLHRRSAAVTIFTTPANSAPICSALEDTDVSILQLPFPENIPSVPPGVENTHDLPTMAAFVPFAKSTQLMQKDFEHALETLHPPLSCIISDGFLGWTLQSAQKFRVPRLVFFGMGIFSSTMYQVLVRERPHVDTKSADDPFFVHGFDNLKLTRNDFDPPWNEIEPSGEFVDFMEQQVISMAMSYGMIVNSFYEIEKCYADYWNEKIGPKAFCIGPVSAGAAPPPPPLPERPDYVKFLDEKLAKGESVLYVAFGTQAEVSDDQLGEIATGLEKSGVNFLWVLKAERSKFVLKFINRTENRGLVVEEWVDQLRILNHGAVKGFLSHCGWNSVMESVSAGVPIIALPFMAEQHLNARLVAEVAGVGVRVMPKSGSVRGFVEAEEVARGVRVVMDDGEKGAGVRRKSAEYGVAARAATGEGGSSMVTLDKLIEEVNSYK